MQTAICLSKVRNKHIAIVGYNLQLENGDIQYIPAEQLKKAIKEGKIEVTNLRMVDGGRLLDKGGKIPSVFNNDSVKKINDNNKPKTYVRKGNPNIELQLITIREKQKIEYWIRNKADDKFYAVDKNHLYALAIEYGIEGVELDGRKIVNITCRDESEYITKVSVPYVVVNFLSLLCIARATVPQEVRKLVDCIERKEGYEPELEGREYTIMVSLRDKYTQIQDNFSIEDFKAILNKQDTNKYFKVYITLFSWYIKNVDNKVIVPDYVWENLAHITGLPKWYIPLMKEDLYILN